MDRLKGKVAIVTGGARGLGKHFCLALAQENAKVVVTDILADSAEKTSQEILAEGGQSIALNAGVTTESETIRMADETLKAFGRIDILVNNAALFYGITRKPYQI